mgnify:CR=1 FL=1
MTIAFCVASFFILAFIVITLANPIITQLLDPGKFLETVKDPEVLTCIGLTLGTSFIATCISLVFGVPLAYLLARKKFFGKRAIEGMVDLPIMIPHMVAGIALFSVFASNGLVGSHLPGIKFFDAVPGVVAAMLFVSAPFLINPVREGFQSVDPRLEKVARSLGASGWQAFYKVTLPIAYKHILSGIPMSWGRGSSEFAAIIILAYYPMVASTMIYEKFLMYGLEGARPVAVLLMLICLGIFMSFRSIRKET